MKNTLSILAIVAAFLISSCKKESKPQNESNQKETSLKTTGLPGGNPTYLQLQPNGTYKVGWYGEMTFGDIPHPIINVVDGTPLEANIINVNNEYISVQTVGPYFMVIRPTFVGAIAPTREQFNNFAKAYNNFIDQKRDANGVLIQPSLPAFDNYVTGNTGNGEIIAKGQVVSWNASPTKMAVVSHTYIPPGTVVPEV